MSCKYQTFFRNACEEFSEKRLSHRKVKTVFRYQGWPEHMYDYPQDCNAFMNEWASTLKLYWEVIDKQFDDPTASPGTRLLEL